jgi:CRP-like cAMP-binding protein
MAWADRGGANQLALRSANFDSSEELMERAGRMRVFEPGQVLFRQGEPCRGVYVIRSGLVGLRRTEEDGSSALLGLSGPGDIAGYRALLADDFHSNTTEVLTHCRVLVIEAAQIKQLINSSNTVREHFVQKALADLTRSQGQCAALLTEGLRSRFIRLLLLIRQSYAPMQMGARYEIELPIQRKDIAALIGAAPASLSRLISELESECLIRVDGRKIEFSAAVTALGHGEFRMASGNRAGDANVLAILMEARRALLSMIDAEDPRVRDALNERVQAASAQLDALLVELSKSNAEAKAAAEFRRVWERFKKTRQTQIIPAIYAGKVSQAKQIATGIQAERLAIMQNIMSHCAN